MGGLGNLFGRFWRSQRPLEAEVVSDSRAETSADMPANSGSSQEYNRGAPGMGRRVFASLALGSVGSLVVQNIAHAGGVQWFVEDKANVIPQWTDPGMEGALRRYRRMQRGSGAARQSSYRSRVGQKLDDLAGSLQKIVTVPIKEIREIPGDIIASYRDRNALRGTAGAVGSIIRGTLEAANGVVKQTTYTALNSSEVVVSALALTNNNTPRLDRAFYFGESFVGGTLDNTWGGDEFHVALRRLYQNIAPGGGKYNPQLFLLEHRGGKKVAAIVYHDGVRLASLFLPYALAEYVVGADDKPGAIAEIIRKGPFKPGGR